MGLKIDRSMRDVPGAYVLLNRTSSEAYVGSSSAIRTRLRRHRLLLNNGEHYNLRLQLIHDENNEDLHVLTFECETLDAARDLEQKILDSPPHGWKLCNVSTDSRVSQKGLIRSEEHKAAISAGNKGKILSPAHIAKIKESRTGIVESKEIRAVRSVVAGGGPLVIDGVWYESARSAGGKLNLNHRTVLRRVRKNKWPTWSFA